MIVNSQRPVLHNKNTNQPNSKQREFNNQTTLKNDIFVPTKTNDNIKFGRSFLREINGNFLTHSLGPQMKVIEKTIINMEKCNLKKTLPGGGTKAHFIAEKFNFEQVDKAIKSLLEKTDVFMDICEIKKPQIPSHSHIESSEGLTLLDIVQNRALSSKNMEEFEKWDELTAKMINTLQTSPKKLKKILSLDGDNLVFAIQGAETNNNKYNMMEKTVKSIVNSFMDDPNYYENMLLSKNQLKITPMQYAIFKGEKAVNILMENKSDKFREKAFNTATKQCHDLVLALEFNKYFSTMGDKGLIHSMKTIANALYHDSKNSYTQWNELKRSERQEIKNTVNKLLNSEIIHTKNKMTLIEVMPEVSEAMQTQYRTLANLN